jgi:hypothetical protein
MTSPKTKPVVTRADREAAWKALMLSESLDPTDEQIEHLKEWLKTGVVVGDGVPETFDTENRVALALATTRTEAHAAGYAECQRDVVEWARGSMSDRHTSANWDAKDTALDELAEGVEAGEHVGAAKEVERG